MIQAKKDVLLKTVESIDLIETNDVKKANLVNPARIYLGIFKEGSFYSPSKNELYISPMFENVRSYLLHKGNFSDYHISIKKDMDREGLLNSAMKKKLAFAKLVESLNEYTFRV